MNEVDKSILLVEILQEHLARVTEQTRSHQIELQKLSMDLAQGKLLLERLNEADTDCHIT